MVCGRQFRSGTSVESDALWSEYVNLKQTVNELSAHHGISSSTVKRRLREIKQTWVQPPLSGGGFVHLDVTYWGRNWGVFLALDNASGAPLYVSFVNHEKIRDYKDAIASIEARGYKVHGIIIDGMKHLFKEFSGYKVQMCQFHMKQIVRRGLTLHPKLHAAKELKSLFDNLANMGSDVFKERYAHWRDTWKEFLNRRSLLKSGKTQYTHKRLRSVVNSINFFLPYLFTYQEPECEGMPNTNNKLEGTFTDLKKNLNNHSGMSEENRKRFICGFFLALEKKTSMKKQEPQ